MKRTCSLGLVLVAAFGCSGSPTQSRVESPAERAHRVHRDALVVDTHAESDAVPGEGHGPAAHRRPRHGRCRVRPCGERGPTTGAADGRVVCHVSAGSVAVRRSACRRVHGSAAHARGRPRRRILRGLHGGGNAAGHGRPPGARSDRRDPRHLREIPEGHRAGPLRIRRDAHRGLWTRRRPHRDGGRSHDRGRSAGAAHVPSPRRPLSVPGACLPHGLVGLVWRRSAARAAARWPEPVRAHRRRGNEPARHARRRLAHERQGLRGCHCHVEGADHRVAFRLSSREGPSPQLVGRHAAGAGEERRGRAHRRGHEVHQSRDCGRPQAQVCTPTCKP